MDLFLSDFDSYSESSSFEDQDDAELIYGGQACCILSSLEETIGKIDDFLSFERGFVHGDIVGLIKDPAGQMGRVTNINMIVDLENVNGNKMKHVDSRKLGKVRSISVGDFVVGGPWVGKVENIVDYVTILFDDGTKCEYSTTGPDKIVPLSPDLLEDSQYPYYPGQRVRVELSTVPKSARWLCGPWKGKHDEGTVCAVDAGKVFIDWFDCAPVSCEKVDVPQRLQRSKDLTVLSCFSHANWQLGDWCTLLLLDDIENASIFGIMKGHKQSERAFERGFTSRIQEIFVIVKTMTKVDVLWQDGSQSLGLDSHSLFPVNIVDAHDFWPDQFVLEKGTSDDPHVTGTERWGAVRTVDAKERTVRVKWESSAINRVPDSQGEVMEEIVSAYELVEHPDYSYSLGDVVFGMHKDPAISIGEVAYLKGDVCGREDYSKSLSNSYLSQIGFIVGFNNGNVEVKWGTGLRTKVAPHEIFRVDKREGLSVTPVLDETAENTSKTEHDNRSMDNEGKDLVDSNFYGEDFQKKPMYSSSLSLPRAALGYFTNIAANLFGSLGPMLPLITYGHISDFLPRPVTPSETEVLELCNLCTAELPPESGDLHTFAEVNSKQKIEETQKREEYPVRSGSNSPENFRKFDMVSDCSDHHFVNGSGKGLTSSLMNRGWLKKVQKEWSILEKDLPETIYVRIYEERMDLLRAAIVGSPGTPYHDGLFFFDILFPPEYPHEPPVVHYNSGGLRVNPNLYESGKVCLSLLNTWTGSGSEVWNPGSSTILQVLLSLQALVLNEKPYFNEAGYDQQIGRAEGEKNSVSYNENAFLVSCKSMLYLLRKPPKNFEVLVEEHFRQRCKYIFQACNAYMEGTPIGCAFGNTKSEEQTLNGSSTGFKIMLGKLIPKLVEAFSDKIMDCSKRINPAE